MAMNIDVSGLADYTPYEGLGKSDLLTKDGIFLFAIAKAVPALAKESKKEMINLVLNVVDDPEKQDDGKSVVHSLVVGGLDKNNKSMVRNLGDLLFSCGFTLEQIKVKIAGMKTLDLEAVCRDTLLKKDLRCYGQIAAEAYTADDGTVQTSSRVQNFVAKAKYDEAFAVRAHRKGHRYANSVAASTASASSGGGLGALAGGVPANGAAKPASGDLAGL